MKISSISRICLLVFMFNLTHSFADDMQHKTLYPKKRKTRETWEYIINFPGEILTFPVYALDKSLTPLFDLMMDGHFIAELSDILVSDDELRGIYPTYESKGGGGLKFYQKDILGKGSKLDIVTTLGLRNRQFYRMHLKRAPFSGAFISSLSLHYQNLSDEPFYGIGNDTPKHRRMNFAHEQIAMLTNTGLDISKYFTLTIDVGLEHNNILIGQHRKYPSITGLAPQVKSAIPGLNDQIRLISIEFCFERLRQLAHNKSSDWQFEWSAGLSRQVNGDKFNYWKTTLDITRYQHLFNSRALVLRTAAQIKHAIHNKMIPFYHYCELGPRQTIRGYSRGRYRDKNMILASIEYRYPVVNRLVNKRLAKSIDTVLFVDAGQVVPDLDKSPKNRFHIGYGAGLRLYTWDKTYTQFYVGFSKDGYRFYFVLN